MRTDEIIRYLSQAGVPFPDIEAILSALDLDINRAGVEKKDIDKKHVDKLFSLWKKGFPSAYISGYVDYYGIRIFVNPSVLIPRTETVDFVMSDVLSAIEPKRIIDLCSGSGVISLLLKKRFPDAVVIGYDIEKEANALARKSAQYNSLFVEFRESDFLKDVEGRFDLLVSNPPYIPLEKVIEAPFEPSKALFSGIDGMDSYRAIFPELEQHMNKDGRAFFELEESKAQDVRKLALSFFKENRIAIHKDMENKDRYLEIDF